MFVPLLPGPFYDSVGSVPTCSDSLRPPPCHILFLFDAFKYSVVYIMSIQAISMSVNKNFASRSLLLSDDHRPCALVGKQFAQQHVRLSSIYNMHIRYSKQGVEAGKNLGYHAAGDDTFLYQLLCLNLVEF